MLADVGARRGDPRPPRPTAALRRPGRAAGRRSGAGAAFDGCFVYDIDDLEAVVEASLAGRRAEAVRAERVVAGEAERFREWQASLAVVPGDRIVARSWQRTSARTSSNGRESGSAGCRRRDRRLVESVTAQIVNKLLHEPTVRMKEAAVTADGVVYAEVVRHLFGLGEEERGGDAAGRGRSAASPAGADRLRPHSAPLDAAVRGEPHRLAAPLPCCCASVLAVAGSR